MNLILSILLFAGFAVNVVETDRETARKMYFEGWQGECGAEALVDSLRVVSSDDDPVLLAYKGAATTTLANCRINPIGKLSIFNEGKKLLETAVANAPENLEVRFIRFTVQSNIPSLLRYDNREADKKFILERLTLQPGEVDQYLRKEIISFMEKNADLTEEEQKQISQITAKR